MSVRNILLLVSLGLSVVIGLVLARGRGDRADADPHQPVLIGLSLDTEKEERWQTDRDLFRARCEALGGKVLVQSANGDDKQQKQDVVALLTAGVKVLVIVPHNGQMMANAVELANKQGVPVIAYDRLIQNCDLDLYLSFDNVRVGEMQARYLVDHLPTPGKGRIVRIYGAPTDNNARLFKQGQDNVLKPYLERGDIQVVHEDWAEDWKPENAKKIVDAAISKQARFEGVLASNDGTAGGAIQALRSEPQYQGTRVTGQDAELAACQRIAAGEQTMTVYKPLKVLATTAAELAVKLARHKPVVAQGSVNNGRQEVPAVLCPIVAVDKSNLMDTVIKDGFRKYDDVYRSVPENQRPPRP